MSGKPRVLWVEDSASNDLSYLTAPIYIDGRYELVIASDVSEAIEHLNREEFTAVIVDIRLPPGGNQEWLELYKSATSKGVAPNLGLQLIRSVLGCNGAEIKIETVYNRPSSQQIGVFTIDCHNDLLNSLKHIGIEVIKQKHANQPQTSLLELISEICSKLTPRNQSVDCE